MNSLTRHRTLGQSLGALLCVAGLHLEAASPPAKKLAGGGYLPNHIQFALKADAAERLSPTGNARRPVDSSWFKQLHRDITDVRGGHNTAENWLAGRPLPSRVRHQPPAVPQMARILTATLREGVDVKTVLAELRANPAIEGADLIYTYPVAEVPNDPDYSKQWAMPKIRAEEAWDISPRTTSIRIAIVDTGVDLNHPDLASAIVYDKGFAGNSTGNAPTDGRTGASHGTHVAGIAAAVRDNSTGVAGVARAKLMALGCSWWDNDEGTYVVADWPSAMNDAIANGADVINCSFGPWPDGSLGFFESLALDSARDHGVLVVCASGNDDTFIAAGAAWDGHDHPVIVGATDPSDLRVSSANWGWGSNFGPPVDLAAPGADIWSTVVNSFATNAGTSMATPHVSGAAALVLSMNPSRITDDGVKHLLKRMAVDLGSSGKDNSFGWGRLSLPRPFIRALREADAFVGAPGLISSTAGDYSSPYASLAVALDFVADGQTLVLNGGGSDQNSYHYPPIEIRKAVILRALPDKPVTIGP